MWEIIERLLPEGSVLKDRLFALHKLYKELDMRLTAFSATGFSACPPGCGLCSAAFEPDILPVEAAYVVLYAMATDIPIDRLEALPEGSCPLYRQDVDAHCLIYPARPLVCRLFGFSALPDRHGELVYTPCEHMEGTGRGGIPLRALGLPADALPPDMTEYSIRLSLIEPGGEAHRRTLRFALHYAVGRIELLRKRDGKKNGGPCDD